MAKLSKELIRKLRQAKNIDDVKHILQENSEDGTWSYSPDEINRNMHGSATGFSTARG